MKTGLQFWRKMLLLHLLISSTLIATYAQGNVVKGKITDAATGEEMPGVNIVVKGTTNGTTSDVNGEFSIALKEGENMMVVSFIGYKTLEVSVSSSQTFLEVKLEADIQTLQEVVVVGYGTQKKSHLTGAVASANMEDYSRIPTGDALNALQGQVAGVNVSASSGNPAVAPVVQIRGIGTINGSAPLYVIDGIPSDISYINPAEIESINVLKDASAATIYGARGANGVILVTTKSGKTGKPQVTFDSFIGVNEINNLLPQANREERNTILINSFNNAGLTPPSYTDPAVQGQYADSEWVDEYFKTGTEQKYDLGIGGGTDQMSYRFSGGFYGNNGTIINSGIKRYNTRLNLEFKNLLKDRLKISTGIAYIRKDVKNFDDVGGAGNAGFSDLSELYQTLPHKAIYDPTSPNGYAGQDPSMGLQGAGNIIGARNLSRNQDQTDYIQLNLGAELKIIKDLSYKFMLGMNSENYYNDQFYPQYNFGPGYEVETPRTFQDRSRTNQMVFNNLLMYNKDFNKHNISVLLGQSSESTEFKSSGGSNLEMPSSSVEALDAGIGTRNSYGSISTNTLLSYFGRASYNYDNRYFLEGSIRKDGSSRFGPDNRWGTFYGVSAGWAIHRENFWTLDAISELKPRYSYGVVGNQNIGDFLYQSVISSGGTILNYGFGTSASPTATAGAISYSLANPEIKWEETATQNIGLDLSVLNNALSFTFDFYKSKTTGMLVETKVPGTSGILTSPVTNAADLENQGFELGINFKKQTGVFTYNISGNVGTSENKITQLGYEGQEFIDGYVEFNNYATTRTAVGTQIGEFYVKEVAGIFQTQAEIDSYKDADGGLMQPNAKPGDFKFVDVNNDGVLDDTDKRAFGSALPKASFGLNFNASWRNFDFAVMFNGTIGNEMYNGFKMQSYRIQYSQDLLGSWTTANSGSDIPRLDRNDPNNNYSTASNYFIEDASYFRLRNLQVGYSLPFAVAEKIGLNKFRIYLGGYNLITITEYTGFDPGLSNFGKLARGVDRGYYPISKSFVAGISLGF